MRIDNRNKYVRVVSMIIILAQLRGFLSPSFSQTRSSSNQNRPKPKPPRCARLCIMEGWSPSSFFLQGSFSRVGVPHAEVSRDVLSAGGGAQAPKNVLAGRKFRRGHQLLTFPSLLVARLAPSSHLKYFAQFDLQTVAKSSRIPPIPPLDEFAS
jgi:hypothetical protein